MKKLSPKAKKNIKFYTLKVLGLIVLVVFAITTLFPYIYMVSNSFKSTSKEQFAFNKRIAILG